MQAKTQHGRHTAAWQYGSEVTDRAPRRETGAFYGATDAAQSDASTEPDGFISRVRREVLHE